ncbi:MAG: bifunctional aspartate kinase/diaminopimelate decarboxylase [Gammaproteobacteria bacterium]|nr:bifunctional aspartate kinase/diaminopimelate decarboxylase [Gammaproteobacteria bacterium]
MDSVEHRGFSGQSVVTAFPQSAFVVMKFGGTSVATADNWRNIARLVQERVAEGFRPVVVHSALAGVSNLLQDLPRIAIETGGAEQIASIRQRHQTLAEELGVDAGLCDPHFDTLLQLVDGVRLVGEISPRVLARIMATGELAATSIGAAFLTQQGLAAQWRDARELLQSESVADQSERAAFLSASCGFEPDEALQGELLSRNSVVVTQGFIARNEAGETVLLGRGGSDTSAAYLAAKLGAHRLEIWTDVPGFFSSDPQAVPSARLLRTLHYREAQEIASAGGGVLHPRSISPVRRYGIPLFLRCTARPDWQGTVVSDATGEDTPRIKAISRRTRITLISMESMEMWHQVGFLAEAFEVFRAHGLSVDLISTSESNVTVSIDLAANVSDGATIERLVGDLSRLCRVRTIEDCAAVTLVGRKIRATLHALSPALEVFEEQNVHLVTQAANDLNLTFVVDTEDAFRLVQRLHALLIHRFDEDSVFGPTWEQLRRPEAEPVETIEPWWQSKRAELLALAEQHDAVYVYERDSVRQAVRALLSLTSVDAVFYAMKANSNVDVLRIVHEEGANFECVSPGEIKRIQELFPDLEPRRILFTPNFAPRSEYAWALEQGVWVTLDNLHPLRYWPELFHDRELFIRLDPGRGRGHHEHVKTAGVHSKFGIPLFELDELEELARAARARIVGLHAHTGSGILTPDNWRETGEQLAQLRSRFTDVRYMDLGGGLGIPEKPGERPLDLDALDTHIRHVKSLSGDAELWLEPGRYLVAQAGVLLARVTQTKGKGSMSYVGVATGMNSLIRPALYGAYHEIVNLSRLEETPTDIVTIVGPNCETGDRLGSDRLLPPTQEGDVLAIANAGAYGYVMSSHYNLREPAVEVLI